MNRNRFFLIAAWAVVSLIVYATLAPLQDRPVWSSDPDYERFVAYAIAGSFLMLAWPERPYRVACFVVAMAVGLELMQTYAIERHARAADTTVKIAGGLVGVFMTRFGVYLSRIIEQRHS